MSQLRHDDNCACCSHPLRAPVGRRGLLLGAAAAAFVPQIGRAATGKKYEAMVLGCIDPRMHEPVREFAIKHGLIGEYSQFTIAGAAIGVVAPAFEKWHGTFWANLEASIHLHHIESVIAIDHRDCGAAKIAYGDASIATPEVETATHKAAMAEFRREVNARHPELRVETLLMALDGTYITFS